MYTGRLRDPGFGARGGPRVGSAMRSPRIFPTRGTSFGFGQTRSFQTGGRPGFQSRDTFGPSSFTSSFDGTGTCMLPSSFRFQIHMYIDWFYGVKSGYLDFSHLTEFGNIYISLKF